MKKKIAVLLLLLVLALSGCVAEVQSSNAVQIPDALRLALSGLILAGVTLGLQALFDMFGLDLRGVGAAVAVAISGFGIAQLQGLIDIIPVAYDQITTIVLNILVVILSGLGALRALLHRERAAALFAPRLR